MYRQYVLFCCLLLQHDCYGCETRENNILCSLFLKAHKIVNGDFRKFTRNILQRDAIEVETLPDIIQVDVHHYEVDKEQNDKMKTRTSSLPMFQTESLKADVGIENKIRYKSSELPKYIVSELPMHQNSSFKSIKKQVAVSSTIHFKVSPYPKISKISEVPMAQNIYRRDSETPVTVGNAIHYDTIKISKSPKLRNSIYKQDIEERVTLGNTIHFEPSAYSKDFKIFESSMSHNNFKRNSVTVNKIHYDTNTDDDKISKPLKLQNSNFKNVMENEVGTHDGKDGHSKDTSNSKTITLLVPKETRSVRVKREGSHFYYGADNISKLEKGIKILEQDPGESGCNYNQCVEICNNIYFAIPIHMAQCYNNSCFCFPKKDLYPPVIKNFLKTHKLFGIQQTYE